MRATWAAIGVFLVAVFFLVADRYDWWGAMARHPIRSWNWVDRFAQFATLLALPVAVLTWRQSARRDGAPPPVAQQAEPGGPQGSVVPGTIMGVLATPGNVAFPLYWMPGVPMNPTRGQDARSSHGDIEMINQVSARQRLTTELLSARSGVTVVHGPPGVGKSFLVETVLRETDLLIDSKQFRLPINSWDAKTLSDALGGPKVFRDDEDVVSWLRMLTGDENAPAVIMMVDGAQCLIDPATGAFADLRVEEALTTLAGRLPRRVKVVVITETEPTRTGDQAGPPASASIAVARLSPEDFRDYLTELQRNRGIDLGAAGASRLHEILRGLPRLANLFCATLQLRGDGGDPRELAGLIEEKLPEHREKMLADALVSALGPERHRVMEALMAFGAPVAAEPVSALLRREARPMLERLTDLHVVTKMWDHYHVPPGAIPAAVTAQSAAPDALLIPAAELLSSRREPDLLRNIESLAQLDDYFVELDIWIRARRWAVAYEMIRDVDVVLRERHAGGLLLRQRQAIAGHLSHADREMVNHNELGLIYLARNRLDEADQAFEAAWSEASRTSRYMRVQSKIYVNMAHSKWLRNDVQAAEERYDRARATAEEQDDLADRMRALAGLADCHRRRGAHAAALRFGMDALSAAQAVQSPSAVGIAVRVARWRSELGEGAEARRLLDVIAEEYPARSAPVEAVYLDACADIELDAGDLREAQRLARKAAAKAMDLHAPALVVQARSTLAMALLRRGRTGPARDAIDGALPYRAEGRSLIVLALDAVIAFREDPDGSVAHFDALKREAVVRRSSDPRDFAAWELEGLARCAARALRDEPLESPLEAFRQAREITPAPLKLGERLEFLIRQLGPRMVPEELETVVAAALGRLRAERP